jgi:hypothetical protein
LHLTGAVARPGAWPRRNACRAAGLAIGLGLAGTGAQAGSAALQFCDGGPRLNATEQDRLLRVAAIVRDALDASGQRVALIARSGLDLQRFGVRYSHAGISLRASENGPWSVRQLYFACEERRPRLFDQGLAGFLFGTDDPSRGYLSIVLLPAEPAAALERAALDKARGLRLLAPHYSANAHPFALKYQNCNQWVAELLAAAWGGVDAVRDAAEPEDRPDPSGQAGQAEPTEQAGLAARKERTKPGGRRDPSPTPEPARATASADGDGEAQVRLNRGRAQAWLAAQGYTPPPVGLSSYWLLWAAEFVPWIHMDDHPRKDRFELKIRTSLPAALEAFVHARLPQAQHLELCHDARHVVLHHGWVPLGPGCEAQDGDRVLDWDTEDATAGPTGADRARPYQPSLPGSPLNGPLTSGVIQPP